MAFWHFSWDFTKAEIIAFFSDFFRFGTFQRSLNSTFLVLIPKKGGAEELKDFRPISLVGSLYKLLAKVLANRLKQAVGEVVSEHQHAFIQNRQILDAALIANEAVDSRLKVNLPGLLLKLDIEKAFDHVNWDCLFSVMSKMGFGQKWINWIRWCISTANFSILINGTPSDFFGSTRGLRQGDPLSPYLFLLVMEVLSQLLFRARSGGYIEGFKVGNSNGTERDLLHLLFADDTLLFCNPNIVQLHYLSWVFLWFEAISGLKVNRDKSEAILVGRIDSLENFVSVLGCKVGNLPSSYLGLPLGAPFKSSRMWDVVEERFRKCLSLWKRQYLSKGGRLTLIKSTLSSLPIYLMSLFIIPRKVCARLEKIQRDFLWGGGTLEKKPHLVNWRVVCADMRHGGLGICSLVSLNKALLGKWSWKFAVEGNSLWKQVIIDKYGVDEAGWCSKEVRGTYGVGVWKAIRKDWEIIRSRSRFIIGNGRKVKFWKDVWCEDQALKDAFPNLFRLAVNKNQWVRDAWEEQGEVGSWNPLFSRHFNDWEMEEVEGLLRKIHPLVLHSDVEDALSWKINKNGSFSIRSLYRSLTRAPNEPFPWSIIWRSWAPMRVSFFAWEASWNRI
ncbi:hypothetical protein PVL29_022489 [Vitis rotundifolia]|uniref:Reverse transcriptase domain-containing protein n=1 Tax=Vitis rotundifolia TaxID=103349 RepID=A0AA38YVL8_VITRO|nr:hypothetical protein PVL29_022489 [Vitis rotundifolia]